MKRSILFSLFSLAALPAFAGSKELGTWQSVSLGMTVDAYRSALKLLGLDQEFDCKQGDDGFVTIDFSKGQFRDAKHADPVLHCHSNPTKNYSWISAYFVG